MCVRWLPHHPIDKHSLVSSQFLVKWTMFYWSSIPFFGEMKWNPATFSWWNPPCEVCCCCSDPLWNLQDPPWHVGHGHANGSLGGITWVQKWRHQENWGGFHQCLITVITPWASNSSDSFDGPTQFMGISPTIQGMSWQCPSVFKAGSCKWLNNARHSKDVTTVTQWLRHEDFQWNWFFLEFCFSKKHQKVLWIPMKCPWAESNTWWNALSRQLMHYSTARWHRMQKIILHEMHG